MKQRGKKKKRMKRNEDNFRDLQDSIKWSNIRIIGVPKEEVTLEGDQKLTDLFKAGDEIQAKVLTHV